MFGKERNGRHLVDGARIGCPLRRTDVDIEQCIACSKLLRIVNDDPPYVICTALREDPRIASLLF